MLLKQKQAFAGIDWPIDPKDVLTSEKDMKQPLLKDAEVFE